MCLCTDGTQRNTPSILFLEKRVTCVTVVPKGFFLWPLGIGKQPEHNKVRAGCGSLFAEAICTENYAPFFRMDIIMSGS